MITGYRDLIEILSKIRKEILEIITERLIAENFVFMWGEIVSVAFKRIFFIRRMKIYMVYTYCMYAVQIYPG